MRWQDAAGLGSRRSLLALALLAALVLWPAAAASPARAQLGGSGTSVSVGVPGVIGVTATIGGLDPLLCAATPCVDFATVYDPGGGQPPVERVHRVPVTLTLLGDVTLTQIDATGSGGNDLAVAVQAEPGEGGALIDTDRLRLRIDKLPGAPADLPVRAELVSRLSQNLLFGLLGVGLDLERLQSFGYDARASSAPGGFVADIDLSDRDGEADTEQVRADLEISAPADSLAAVHESFDMSSGSAPSQRADVQHAQLGFRGDPAQPGTRVPSRAAVEITQGGAFQRFGLERLEPTVAELLARAPGDDPKVTAKIDLLPSEAELTIAEVGGGEEPDQRITYRASDPVADARIGLERLVDPDLANGELTPHRQKLAVAVADLPDDLTIDYSAADGRIDYEASARATSVRVEAEDEVPLFERARAIDLRLTDLPTTASAEFGDGGITFGAGGDQLGELSLTAREAPGAPLPDTRPCHPRGGGPPGCDDGLELLRNPDLDGVLLEDSPDRYLLAARVRRLRQAEVRLRPDLDAKLDTGDPDGGERGPFDVSLRTPREDAGSRDLRVRVDRLQPQTEVRRSDDGDDTFSYRDGGSGPGPSVLVQGLNLDREADGTATWADLRLEVRDLPAELTLVQGESGENRSVDYTATARPGADAQPALDLDLTSGEPFFGRADEISLALTGLPDRITAGFGEGDLDFKAPGQPLGGVEVTAKQRGAELPTERPCRPDGVAAPDDCEDGLDLLRDAELDGVLLEDDPGGRYLLHVRVRRLSEATVVKEPDLDALIDTQPGDDGRRRAFDVSLRTPKEESPGLQDLRVRISLLQERMRFRRIGEDEDGTSRYIYTDARTSPGEGHSVTVDGLNLDKLPEGNAHKLRDVHVQLDRLPYEVEFSHRSGTEEGDSEDEQRRTDLALGFRADPFPVDKLELFMTSGPDERLPDSGPLAAESPSGALQFSLQGLYTRDLSDRYVVHARIERLRRASIEKSKVSELSEWGAEDCPHPPVARSKGSELRATLESSSPKAFRIDTQSPSILPLGPLSECNARVGRETTFGTVHPLPRKLDIHTITSGEPVPGEPGEFEPGDSITRLDLELPDAQDEDDFGFELLTRKLYPVPPNGLNFDSRRRVKLSPLPKTLDICASTESEFCTADEFGLEANKISLRAQAEPPISFTYQDDPNLAQFSTFTNVHFDFLSNLALQAYDDDDGGHFGIDTGWRPPVLAVEDPEPPFLAHTHPLPPPQEDRLVGRVRSFKNLNNWVDLRFEDDFAADRRVFRYEKSVSGGAVLILPFLDSPTSGHVNCRPGTMDVRANTKGVIATHDLSRYDRFCENHPPPP